jgi:hypothetical protein
MPAAVGHDISLVAVDDLKLDLENPRFVDLSFDDEAAMIEYLNANADLSELLLSILNSGFMDFEPIVVRRGDNVVLEGNRRVAALRLIRNIKLREKLSIKLPADPIEAAMPKEIRAVLVNDASEARKFIGFKHINGPQKWDAMSKAKYAADWHAEGASLEEISRSLGDTFNTVTRLVEGYRVYKQALGLGFDPERRTARRFAFSHLYTALTRSSIKQWLDLQDDEKLDPVPKQNADRLQTLMSWLYGQGEREPAVVRSQNPDLNRLADVIGNERTLEMLSTTRNLSIAYEELEPQQTRLENSLIQAVRHTENAAAIVSSFDGRASTFELGQRLWGAARDLFKNFRDKRAQLEGLDEDL